MTSTFVALDLETTGLDPELDAITEIGAVRFRADGEVIETFEQLVNPGRPIPAFIQRLTGVTDSAVLAAPPICEVLPRLSAFVGADPLVGHNLAFDLSHLRSAGFVSNVPCFDTAELSRVLIPDRQPRGLGELATALGVPPQTMHRALADSQTAAAVFTALLQRVDSLAVEARSQLAGLVALSNIALAQIVGGPDWDPHDGRMALPELRAIPAPPPLEKLEGGRDVSAADVEQVLDAARTVLPGFEERREQREMAQAVRSALADGGHWMIEAGTGVGKSLAYLVPAALHALRHGERIVVSTNTINLQSQLLKKDIPALREILKRAGVITADEDLRVALLKGRSNYLCLNRFHANYISAPHDPDFERLAASMLLWLPRTETGDRNELSMDHGTYVTWQRLSAQDATCLQQQNRFVREGTCFLQRARKAAESAHILVVNHALLLADLVAHGSAIPPFEHLVVDEAHNLEDVATNQLGLRLTRRSFEDALDGIYHKPAREGRAGGAACLLRGLPDALRIRGTAIEESVERARGMLTPFWRALANAAPGDGDDDRLLVTNGIRGSEAWSEVELAWDAADGTLGEVLTLIAGAQRDMRLNALEHGEAFATELESAGRRLEEFRTGAAMLVAHAGEETIVWLSRDRDGMGALNAAPLEVGPRLWDELWSGLRSVVATSATLSAAGDMRYSEKRLGLERPETLKLGSPFDYRTSTLLTSFTDLPDPSDRGYVRGCAQAIATLASTSQGRALALFTSYSALNATAEILRPMLEEQDIAVLAQGEDGTAAQLRDALSRNSRTLLLGTAGFWEGVDIRGDALSMLIIARLPFAVPTDPIHEARAGQYERGWDEYTLPAAILRFRQGFGRLIRDRHDRGVVAVLDSRVWSKRYGRQFVEALPPCTMFRGSMAEVSAEAAHWLAR